MNIIATSEITPAIRKWKPYPGYKDSGVEWLGTIPEHWNVSTLKLLAPTVQRGKSPDYVEEGGIPVINQACVYWEGLRLENIKYDSGKEGNDGKGRLFPGDVLVNSTGTGTLGRASVFRHEETHLADGHVTVVRVDQTAELPEYFFYLLQTPIYQGFIYAALVSGSTNQIELSRESFRATPTIVPPIREQARIVGFLDRETAKIDALVSKKERLIELLQEKRTALISRAVTKGLDPNVPMKDSGVEWLGEIPVHWERKPAKAVCQRIIDCKNRTPEYDKDGDFPVIRTTDVKDGRLSLAQCLRTDEKNFRAWTLRGAPQRDDILFTREAPAGEAAFYDGTHAICLGQRMMYFRVNPEILVSRFLLYSIYGALVKGYILAGSGGSTVTHLRLGQVYNLPLLIPPVTEQSAIVGYLDGHTTTIDRMVAKVREGIERLQEYRTALITAAVTGKIDVRGETSL